MSLRCVWEQCDNKAPHLPHVDEDFTTVWICEGVTRMQALLGMFR